jgi:CDP-glucose 4,6-dehydratase
VLGTINVLDALRRLTNRCAAVIVTTDKCYENREWLHGYRETDPLGGHDPYSSSKAAAEIAVASWRRSFFESGHPVRIATARAGNVIGGGDWAADRIVPDSIRALLRGAPIDIRNPRATRPWQHVLEPTSGYMSLAAALHRNPSDSRLATCFNIGPGNEANQPVQRLVETALQHWPGTWQNVETPSAPHEASLLHLDSGRILGTIGWRPTWDFAEAVGRTVAWYRDMAQDVTYSACTRTLADIRAYEADATHKGIPWAPAIALQTTALPHR